MLRIYNDWLKDFCSHYPERQIGLACLPYGAIDDAVAEIHRVAKMGIKRLELSCSWDMEPMWHPGWEQLWQAVEDVQLPLHFHTFPTTPPRVARQASRPVRRRGDVHRRLGLPDGAHQHHRRADGRRRLGALSAPSVAFGESGIGWLPYALDRMDFEYEDRFRDLIKMKPTEYWRRQCRHLPVRPGQHEAVDEIGVETDDVGLRLPAHRRVWPESSKYIAEQFAGLPADVVHKITCENAGKFYG